MQNPFKQTNWQASLSLLELLHQKRVEAGATAVQAEVNNCRKAVSAAVTLIRKNQTPASSFLRKKVAGWLKIDLVWCQFALAAAYRWSLAHGGSRTLFLRAAASKHATSVSVKVRQARAVELLNMLQFCSDAQVAFHLLLELHALLAPEVDISDPDVLGQVFNGQLSGNPVLNASLGLSVALLFVGMLFLFRMAAVVGVTLLFTGLGAKVLAGALALSASRVITKGALSVLGAELTKVFALLKLANSSEVPHAIRGR